MKKYIIILAAAVCALCACQKHEIELLDKPIIEQIDANTYTYTFSAVISDNVSEVEEDGTKATVSRAGAFAWAINDELKFFKEDGTWFDAKITAIDTEGSTATITVYGVDSRASFVSAIYPASAAVEDQPFKVNFNVRGPIVVADVTSGTLTFHHIGSLINLKFYDISGLTAINSLVFEPASAFNYDGSFTFDGSHVPSLTKTGSTAKIVVPASSSDNNSDITVVVPSVNLSGFSAALNSESDGSGRNLFKKSTATAHDLATKRPVLMNMKRVAYTAPQLYFISTNSSRGKWDVTEFPMIKTGANYYVATINTDFNTTYTIYDEYNIGNENAIEKTGSFSPDASSDIGLLSDWTGWDIASKIPLRQYNGKHYILDQVVSNEKYFVLHNGSYRAGSYGNNEMSSYTLPVDSGYGTKFDGTFMGSFKIETGGTYNIYCEWSSGDSKNYIWYSASDQVSPLNELVFDDSGAKSLTVNRQQEVKVAPFDNSSIISGASVLSLKCASLNSGNDIEFSPLYSKGGNFNHIWAIKNLTIPSDNTYSFILRGKGSDTYKWYIPASGSEGQTPFAGNLYGTLVSQGSADNATVSLTAGKYDVYVNAQPHYGNKAMLMQFVKK